MSFYNYAPNADDFFVIQESCYKILRSAKNSYPWPLVAQAELKPILNYQELAEPLSSNNDAPRARHHACPPLVTPGAHIDTNSNVISNSLAGGAFPACNSSRLLHNKYFLKIIFLDLCIPAIYTISKKSLRTCSKNFLMNNNLTRLTPIKTNTIGATNLGYRSCLVRANSCEPFIICQDTAAYFLSKIHACAVLIDKKLSIYRRAARRNRNNQGISIAIWPRIQLET